MKQVKPKIKSKHLPTIITTTLKHKCQRYETCGDYFEEKSEFGNSWWRFRISETNARYEALVLIHELVEWLLTQDRHITEEEIMDFDLMYEEERKQGKHKKDEEPGFDKRAPYRKEHAFATKIEKLLAVELGVSWKEYSKVIDNL